MKVVHIINYVILSEASETNTNSVILNETQWSEEYRLEQSKYGFSMDVCC